MSEIERPAAVILAGGLSRRMGGIDKPLADLDGAPMIAHVVARLRPQVSVLAINANGDPSRFLSLGLPILPDPIPGFIGPLAGLLAALRWAADMNAPLVVSVSGDTPFLPEDLVARLCASMGNAEIAAARSRGAIHPTIALWNVRLANELALWLRDDDRRAMHEWIASRSAVAVDFPDDEGNDPFFNVNTPADLDSAHARLRRAGVE